ncbi:DeoR family transcriptional regulator [Herbiconiux sp. P17]|uniref:DeoR family transcriptional regulator n=1 Tax=Herbiconiux wuyangfengii TaxID=3342794 RepID=UPI0035B90477
MSAATTGAVAASASGVDGAASTTRGASTSRAAGTMQSRREGILAALATAGRVEVTELARTLGVAEETVRRDLRSLEAEGLLVRAHGGAIPAAVASGAAIATEAAADEAARTRALAEAVLELLPGVSAVSGSAVVSGVYLDGGPVGEALAAMLPAGRGIRIVTASVPVALAAAAVGEPPEIHLFGGIVGADGSATGAWARELAATLNLDVAVIEPAGIGASGRLLAVHPDRAAVTERVAAAAGTVLMVAGPRGLTATGLAGSIPLADVDRAVLDAASGTPHLLQRFAEESVAVRVIEPAAARVVAGGIPVPDADEPVGAHLTAGVPA